ncbi:FadR/GntR family transcriptional regulator [Pararhizobium mangrovi]|uniref:FadR family transcriptional regulator n=1 Tax=Pararhizobium mangrovi TaxID=2590452 RepID=A0A506UCE3_9HYPH|nr:FadR/GntR family transcriptional regulator [Pararhizobium mangrovi]TPW30634.1 FadR family transcriptional regulator [Pararhizobium mangrovi]
MDHTFERSKLHVSVVDRFEADILSGTLAVGDRLPAEAEIAKAFNVSTRSVREAIQVLETKGLVRRKHGERAMVVRDDVGEFLGSLAVTVKQLFSQKSNYLAQLMDVRRMIELEAVGRIVDEGHDLNSEVEKAIADMRLAVERNDFERFADCDAAFHLGIVHSVGNEILSVFYDNLFALINEVIRVTSRVPKKALDAAYAEHEEIYDLIRSNDANAARQSLASQIDNSARYLKVALDEAEIKNERNP